MAKKLTVQSELAKSTNISKDVWKIINRHRNKSVKNNTKLILKSNNKIMSDPLDIVNIFAKQFDFKSSTTTCTMAAMDILRKSAKRVTNDLVLDPVTPFEIFKMVKKMDDKKSCGYDDINITVIKENIDVLAEPLSILYNKCFDEGIFPDQLKIAKIIPVHKKSTKTDPKMYRPISLLPIHSKILEKLIKTRLLRHFNLNGVLSRRQFGYQKNVGTQDAISTLIKDVVSRLDDKQKVAGLFLDLSSAFDSVDHKLLLEKLEHYGIRGKVLALLTSYLKNRKMFVEIKAVVSQTNSSGKNCPSEETYRSQLFSVHTGVPQGSILGPIFFIVFVNDLIQHMSEKAAGSIQLVVFADDTIAVVSADNIQALNSIVNQTLDLFHSWFAANSLKVNASKTNVMLFRSTSRNKDNINCVINGETVNVVPVVKFLGVHIDSQLKWKQELTHLEKAISSACYVLRSLRTEVTIKHLKMVYYALVESKLRYSILFWGGSYDYNTQKAFVIQKRAVRTIARIQQQESCKPHFNDLNILTVPSLYILVLLSHLSKYIFDYETEDERQIRESTRRKDLQMKQVPHLNVVKHSAYHKSLKMFNKLPIEIKSLVYTSGFQNKLKWFLLNKCLYSIDEL